MTKTLINRVIFYSSGKFTILIWG